MNDIPRVTIEPSLPNRAHPSLRDRIRRWKAGSLLELAGRTRRPRVHDAAVGAYRAIAESDPHGLHGLAAALHLRGMTLVDMEDLAEAESLLERLNDESAVLLGARAEIALLLGLTRGDVGRLRCAHSLAERAAGLATRRDDRGHALSVQAQALYALARHDDEPRSEARARALHAQARRLDHKIPPLPPLPATR